ncbi:autotransporter outer membrane beta-barrel domain-containing protein [Paraburkholderia sp. JHI869]|uniref:autotransporter family protein n=1 Tax=Paraburkholderia sp. JHI869 TaxID=3112959 RepID=UPI00317B8B15
MAGTLPGVSHATPTIVSNQGQLSAAISAANTPTVIQLGASFTAATTLTSTVAITLDTLGFTLTGINLALSGPSLTFDGTFVGTPQTTVTSATPIQVTGASTTAVNNGTMTGGAAAAGRSGGYGAILSAVTFVNNGTLKGGNSSATGAAGTGVQIGRGATLTNNGTIAGGDNIDGTGTSGYGLSYGLQGATLINNGTIRGGSDLTGTRAGNAAIYVRVNSIPMSIVNTGTIVGGNGAVAITASTGVDLVNSGTIQAGTDQTVAIRMPTAGVDAPLSLELQAGSKIIGTVFAMPSSTNTLTLGGTANDVFDVSSIGPAAQYQNFNVLQKTGTSTWALTGTGTATTPWSIQQGTLQIGNGGTSGSVIGNITDNATLAFDRSDVFAFDNLVSGTGAVNQVGSGTTILTAANTYTGETNVLTGTLAIGDAAHTNASIASGLTTVATGATLGGYGTVSGSVNNSGTVAAANALAAFASASSGTFSIGGSLSNAGVVNLAAASGTIGNVLNVAGNYTGANGLVVLNTLLNAGGASSQTDRLVVGGNASGTTAIKVNQSGTGAQTTGDGIQLVQVNGTSAANSFHLAAPIQAGAYQYLLYQGGTTDANNWYLRSQLEAAQTTPADPLNPTTAPTTSAAATGPVAYRPAVVGYSVTPLLNADYGFSILDRLHERVGDVASADAAQPAHSNGVWGRIGGQNLDADAGDRFSTDERTFFAQFGRDWTLSRDANGGSTHTGAMITIGSTSATFADSARSLAGMSGSTGSVETQAQSFGGYWTKYLPDGTYFDGVGQLTHYHNRYGDVFGGGASQNGFGAGASGEIGKPFALGSTGIAIEPQAQLLYQYLHLNGFDDGIAPVGSNTTNALRGRLGFRLFSANLNNDSKTSSVTPYFTADVLHDFFSPGQATVGGTPFDNALQKTWYAVGFGITGSFGKRSEVYANVKYEHSLGGEYRRNVFGQAGYRFSW